MRIAALLLADKAGTYQCSPCVEALRHVRLGCSKMGCKPLTKETSFLSVPDPRMRRGPFGRLTPSPPIQPTDCPRAYVDAWTGQMLEVWGHLRASRDYFGVPAGRWPCKVSAAMSVLSEEVARMEAIEREANKPDPHAYQPGPGLPLEQSWPLPERCRRG